MEHLGRIIELCHHAHPDAWKNGVTDSSGTMDEGDVRSFEIVSAAENALKDVHSRITATKDLD